MRLEMSFMTLAGGEHNHSTMGRFWQIRPSASWRPGDLPLPYSTLICRFVGVGLSFADLSVNNEVVEVSPDNGRPFE